MSEHEVIVEFEYRQRDLGPIFELQDRLDETISAAGVGEFDGNEIAVDGSEASFFMYGPDADKIYEAILPVLESVPFMRGATVLRRYGINLDAEEVTTTIGPRPGD